MSYSYLDIITGNAPGYSVIHKGAENLAVGTAFEDLWSYGGTKTLSTVAATYYISSSHGDDVGSMLVEGIDANWKLQSQLVTLVGQTKTEIGSGLTWMDVYRVTNVSATPLVGTVYVYEENDITTGVPGTATKVRASITIGNEITKQGIFPIPAETKGYLTHVDVSLVLGLAKTGTAQIMLKPFGEVWKARHTFSFSGAAQTGFHHPFNDPFPLPAKSFIKVRCKLSAEDEVSGGFIVVLHKQGGL